MLPLLFGMDTEKKDIFKWFPVKGYEMLEPIKTTGNNVWIGNEEEIDVHIEVVKYKLVRTIPDIKGGLYEKTGVSK